MAFSEFVHEPFHWSSRNIGLEQRSEDIHELERRRWFICWNYRLKFGVKWKFSDSVRNRGRHSDKFSSLVRPTAEPRSKIFGLSDREPSRAELSNCPKIARLGSRLGSRALFRTNSDTGQPSSRDTRNTFLIIIDVFFIFLLNYYLSRGILCISLPSNLNFSEK